MATYLESLNILPPEYWEGGGEAGELGALNYLTNDGSEITDPLVGNPFLEAALAESDWANPADDGEGFRPLTPYIPFADRSSGLPSDTPTGLYDPNLETMPSDIWNPEGIDYFGGPDKMSQLWQERFLGGSSAQADPSTSPFHPRAIDKYGGYGIREALQPLGYRGGNRFQDYNPSFSPNDPNYGWMNLPWSLKTEAPMMDKWNLMAPPGSEGYAEAYDDAVTPLDWQNARKGKYSYGPAGLMSSMPKYGGETYTFPSGYTTGTFNELSPSSDFFRKGGEVDIDPQDYSSRLIQGHGGKGDYGQAYQEQYKDIGRQMGSFAPPDSNKFYAGWNAQDTLERMATLSDDQGMAGYMPNYTMDAVGESGSPMLEYADKAGYKARPNIADLSGMNLGTYEAGGSRNPWQGYFSSDRLGDSLDDYLMGVNSDAGGMTEKQMKGFSDELTREAMGGSEFGAGDWGTGKWRELANIMTTAVPKSDLGFGSSDVEDLGPEAGTTYLDAIKTGFGKHEMVDPLAAEKMMPYVESYINRSHPSLYRGRDYREDEKGAVDKAVENIMLSDKGPYKWKEEKLKTQQAEFEDIKNMYEGFREEEPIARGNYLADEQSAVEKFNEVRENVIGNSTGGTPGVAGIGEGGLTFNVKQKQMDALDNIKAELYETFQGPEGTRTKEFERLYGTGGTPGALKKRLVPGAEGDIYQGLVTNPYAGYLTSLEGIEEARTTGMYGLPGIEETYAETGGAPGSSMERKAKELYSKKWETLEPAYRSEIGDLQEEYDEDITDIGEERETSVKESKQDYREDERSIDKKLRDLDLETASARRKIRGFSGGGLVSGRRGRLGGEEYQKLLQEREALIAEKKASKKTRRRDIGTAREESQSEIGGLTKEAMGEVASAQTGPQGVEAQLEDIVTGTGELSVEGALTKAEEDYWSKSEDTEETALVAKDLLESDVGDKSVKQEIEESFAISQPDFALDIATGQEQMAKDKALALENIKVGLPSELGDIPQLQEDLFGGDESLMEKAKTDAPVDALAGEGAPFGVEDIPTERADFIRGIEEGTGDYKMSMASGLPGGLSDASDFMETSVNTNIGLGSPLSGRDSLWASDLYKEYESQIPDILGEKRGHYIDRDLWGPYASSTGDTPFMAGNLGAGGSKWGAMAPDFMPAKYGDWGGGRGGQMNFLGEKYYPGVLGEHYYTNEGIPGYFRSGAGSPGANYQAALVSGRQDGGGMHKYKPHYPFFNLGQANLKNAGRGFLAPYGALDEFKKTSGVGWTSPGSADYKTGIWGSNISGWGL